MKGNKVRTLIITAFAVAGMALAPVASADTTRDNLCTNPAFGRPHPVSILNGVPLPTAGPTPASCVGTVHPGNYGLNGSNVPLMPIVRGGSN